MRYSQLLAALISSTVIAGCSSYGTANSETAIPSAVSPGSLNGITPRISGQTIRPHTGSKSVLLVANHDGGSVLGFDLPTPGGNILPDQDISGANTSLVNPLAVAVGPSGGIWASDDGSTYLDTMRFPAGATGNVTPGISIGTSLFAMAVDGSSHLWGALDVFGHGY